MYDNEIAVKYSDIILKITALRLEAGYITEITGGTNVEALENGNIDTKKRVLAEYMKRYIEISNLMLLYRQTLEKTAGELAMVLDALMAADEQSASFNRNKF